VSVSGGGEEGGGRAGGEIGLGFGYIASHPMVAIPSFRMGSSS
jgi:hypothetical protein